MGVGVPNLTDMLELKMQYDSERQKVLARNIAGKDIPDYKAMDLVPLDFKNVLASETGRVNLAITSDKHLAGFKAAGQNFASMVQKHTFDSTITGNTVSTEEQMMKVAQNAMDFQMSADLYKKVGNLFKEALGLQPSP